MRKLVIATAVVAGLVFTGSAQAQPTPARAEAMKKLSFMSGVWAGPASGTSADRSTYKVWQVERMGPMLDGDVIVVEGRGYKDDGSTGFNAFGVVSWDPGSGKYTLRSYTGGYAGSFDLTPTGDGYVWEIPAGPGGSIRFTATVKDNHWREIGEYVSGGKVVAKTFEMNLTRVSDTDWPLGKPLPPTTGR